MGGIKSADLVKMVDLDLSDKKVLIREDLNVPIRDGKILSDQRIVAVLPTIRSALSLGGRVMLLSHLGRPKEGQVSTGFSLAPVAGRLSELLDREVRFVRDWLNGVTISEGDIVLCENVRFNAGELDNSIELSKKMAALTDVFVMDAFGTAHRAQASTEGVARYVPIACAGPLLVRELEALHQALKAPLRPLLSIVGGAKVSTKLSVLESLSGVVDQLIPGGGIANTFLAAVGYDVGKSLHEKTLIPEAKRLLTRAEKKGNSISLPSDVVVAKECSASAEASIKGVREIAKDDLILDIGPDTADEYASLIRSAGTIVWNGPVGVFELEQFSKGTQKLASVIAHSPAFSIAGGGDTLAAVERYNVGDQISYLSTGGGAFLEFLEGRQLPAVAILEKRGAH
jgi:phosphoglycerate kinase